MFGGFPARLRAICARDNDWLRLTGDDHRQVQSVGWSVAMRRLLLVAVMGGVVSGARAADMPDLPFLRGSFTEGLSSSTVNWQGGYIGGHAAYGTSNMNFTGSTRTVAARLMDGLEMEQVQRISEWPIMG